jgi:hypothetical protein
MSRNTPSIQAAIGTPAPSYLSVTTSTGFNRGDLVFQSGGDFQQLTSQATTAVFPNNVAQPVLSGVLGGAGGSVGFPTSTSSTSTSGGSDNRNAALLTNGNIVIVGSDTNPGGAAYFTIYNSSLNVVVSRVTLPTTFLPGCTAGVVGLTGGGFVIYYTNASTNTGRFNYAIYSNTGTVVTALQQATNYAVNSASTNWHVAALNNGGFAATNILPGTLQVCYYIFNSTGTQLFNNVLTTLIENGLVVPSITAGASGSFFILYRNNNGNEYQYVLINSSNTQLATGAITHSLGTTAYNFMSVATLSDGINVVLFYLVDASTFVYRFFNTSTNILSSATTISPPLSMSSVLTNYTSTAVRSLSSGGFILFFQTALTINISSSTGIHYGVFNSSGVSLGSSTQTSLLPVYKSIIQSSTGGGAGSYLINQSLSTLESGGNLYLFFNPFAGGGGSSAAGPRAYTNFIQLDLTNYNPVSTLTYTAPIGTSTSSTGSVALSGSTPNRVSYSPLSNSVTQILSTSPVATTPTRVASLVSTNIDVCTLTNGNFVVLYRNETTFAVTAQVYNPLGTLLKTIFVGTGSPIAQFYSARITPLAGGKFVVVYTINNTTLSVNIFSSNYVPTSIFLLTGLIMSAGNNAVKSVFSLGSISSDRFIITALSSVLSANTYWVFSNTGTQLATGSLSPLAVPIAVNGHQSGGFTVAYNPTLSQIGYGWFSETSTNTFALQNSTTLFGLVADPAMSKIHINQFNEVFIAAPLSGWAHSAIYSSNNNSNNWYIASGISRNSGNNFVLNVPMASGLRAFIDLGTASAQIGLLSSSSTKFLASTLSNITVPSSDTTAVVSPLYGNTFVLVYPNLSDGNFVNFSIITLQGNPSVNVLNTTSSVSNATSLANPNYPFVGVAANTVPPGGVGIVQTSGLAQLNSNYSSSTVSQAFDSQTPGGLGVRGTLVGRNINLLGNTQ